MLTDRGRVNGTAGERESRRHPLNGARSSLPRLRAAAEGARAGGTAPASTFIRCVGQTVGGPFAQLAEQRTFDPKVQGSNP